MSEARNYPTVFGFNGDDYETKEPFWEEGVRVGQFSVIGVQPIANSANRRPVRQTGAGRIGARTVIGLHCTVYAGTFIGRDCRLGDYASVREDCRIGDRVVIGTHADIQYGCLIGNDVRIFNQSQLAGGTVVGDGTFIGPGVQTANHRHVDLGDYRVPDEGHRAPIIGKGVMIGVGAILLPGVTIGDSAVIMAGALVTKDIPAGETWGGSPAAWRQAARPHLEKIAAILRGEPAAMPLVDAPLTEADRDALAAQSERA